MGCTGGKEAAKKPSNPAGKTGQPKTSQAQQSKSTASGSRSGAAAAGAGDAGARKASSSGADLDRRQSGAVGKPEGRSLAVMKNATPRSPQLSPRVGVSGRRLSSNYVSSTPAVEFKYLKPLKTWEPTFKEINNSAYNLAASSPVPVFRPPEDPSLEKSKTLERFVEEPTLERTKRHSVAESPPNSAEMNLAAALGINVGTEKELLTLARTLHSLKPPVGWLSVTTDTNETLYKRAVPDPRDPSASPGKERMQAEHPMFGHYLHLVHQARHAPRGARPPQDIRPKPVTTETYARPTGLFLSSDKGVPVKKGKKTEGIDPSARDFNNEFQALWSSTPLQPGQLRDREIAILDLLNDFEEEARLAAVDFVHNTACGDRNNEHRVGNLLMTYQNSTKHVEFYGTREIAVKMVQHEFTGYHVIMSANLKKLHVPLHCTIYYLGNRVTVTAALPLSKHSKILGPANSSVPPDQRDYRGGSDAEPLLQIVASDYRLKTHTAPNSSVIRVGAALTEVHVGADGRYYVTQASRTLPALPILLVDSDLYRPELVKNYRLSKENGLKNYFKMDEQEVLRDLSRYRDEETVQFFASWLCSADGDTNVQDGDDLADVFHHFGLNMDKLKLVHDRIHQMEDISTQLKLYRCTSLRNEMLARALKAAIRESDDKNDVFQEFMDDPAELLAEYTMKKFQWDPREVYDISQGVVPDREAILKRLSMMLQSGIQTSRGPDGSLRLQEVALNQEKLKGIPRPKPSQPVFTFSRSYLRFRPEVMRALNRNDPGTHISSDALTAEALEGDVTDDTAAVESLLMDVLLKEVIPKFSSNLLRRPPEDNELLCTMLHENGINIRFLGIVLFHLTEWKDDGDWRTIRDPGTGTPTAILNVVIEMLARTFFSFLEDKTQGKSYAEATLVAKGAFQALLDDQLFIRPRMKAKFPGAPRVLPTPPADKVFSRICELAGCMVVLRNESEVAEVAFNPVAKTTLLPPHLRTKWLATPDSPVDITFLPPIEHALVERAESRPKGDMALPILAILSVLYQRWEEEEPGTRQQQLLDCRLQLASMTDPNTTEHGDANLLLGDYFKYLEDYRQASRYYTNSYTVLRRQLGNHEEVLEAVLGLASVLRLLGDERQAMEWFEEARKIATNLGGRVSTAKIIEIDTVTGECFAEECRYNEAVKHFSQAIDLMEKSGDRDETQARLLEQRARAYYSMFKYDESCRDFEKALLVYKETQGASSLEIANIAICLGQIYLHEGRLRDAKEMFETALDTYKSKAGDNQDDVRSIVVDHLAPCYQRMGLMSQYHKCLLEVLLAEHDEYSDPVAQKYFEVAIAYEKEKRKEQAIKYFQLALIAHRKVYGPDHKYTQKCLDWLKHLGGKDPAVEEEDAYNEPLASPRFGSPRGDSHARLQVPGAAGKKDPPAKIWDRTQPHQRSFLAQRLHEQNTKQNQEQYQQQLMAQQQMHQQMLQPQPQYLGPDGIRSPMMTPQGLTPVSQHLDVNGDRVSPGSPSFVRESGPRTVGTILQRCGLASLSNIPTVNDNEGSDTSSGWD